MTAGAAGKDLHAAVPDDHAIEPGTIVLVPITDRARGGFGHSAVCEHRREARNRGGSHWR